MSVVHLLWGHVGVGVEFLMKVVVATPNVANKLDVVVGQEYPSNSQTAFLLMLAKVFYAFRVSLRNILAKIYLKKLRVEGPGSAFFFLAGSRSNPTTKTHYMTMSVIKKRKVHKNKPALMNLERGFHRCEGRSFQFVPFRDLHQDRSFP